jgi:hypothetical protein
MDFLADGGLAERALNRAFPLDREHKRLGSGLIDHSQKMTAAAMQIAEK